MKSSVKIGCQNLGDYPFTLKDVKTNYDVLYESNHSMHTNCIFVRPAGNSVILILGHEPLSITEVFETSEIWDSVKFRKAKTGTKVTITLEQDE